MRFFHSQSIRGFLVLIQNYYISSKMSGKKLSLDSSDVLCWLLDRGYVEPTSSANAPYRIAVNEEDSLPFTITFLSKKLSERFSKVKLRSINRKSWKRELMKCIDEYQIQYDDQYTRAGMHWDFKPTIKKYLEQKLGIDLDALHEHDRAARNAKGNGGMRYTSYFNQQKGRYGEERALILFKRYFNRRMQDLYRDCRNGRPKRAMFEDTDTLINSIGGLKYDSQRTIGTA